MESRRRMEVYGSGAISSPLSSAFPTIDKSNPEQEAKISPAFGQIETYNANTGRKELIGSWNEDFHYTDEDIEAYLDFAEKAGYKHIVLAGHSLGANKVIQGRELLIQSLLDYSTFVSAIEKISNENINPISVQPTQEKLRKLLNHHPVISPIEIKEAFDLPDIDAVQELIRSLLEEGCILIRNVPHGWFIEKKR